MARPKKVRLEQLRSRLNIEQQSTIEDLASFFSVSTATVRRDLKELESRGEVIQTVGGGVMAKQEAAVPLTPGSATRAIEEKIRIAEYCTELVRDMDDILVAPGTTTFLAGKIMSGITDRSFRIITNSLELALETESCENIRTVLLGGEVWKRHTLTADNVSEYFSHCHRHHTLLLSADGIHRENGLSIFESRPMATMQEMIRVSDRVVLLSDSGKFGQAHFNRLADWKDIDLLVTDAAAPTGDLDFIRKQDIEVIIV